MTEPICRASPLRRTSQRSECIPFGEAVNADYRKISRTRPPAPRTASIAASIDVGSVARLCNIRATTPRTIPVPIAARIVCAGWVRTTSSSLEAEQYVLFIIIVCLCLLILIFHRADPLGGNSHKPSPARSTEAAGERGQRRCRRVFRRFYQAAKRS